MEKYLVVDNVCGWPKLTLMDDGSINLDVHNRPYHGSADGSAECWKSTDGGRFFEKVGVSGEGNMEIGPYIDKACGVTNNGDYMVIVELRFDTPAHIFRSKDGGKNFEMTGKLYSLDTDLTNSNQKVIPYGDIVRLGNNRLAFSYWIVVDKEKNKETDKVREAHIRFSNDDGYTWDEDYLIGYGINETAILFYDNNEAIAVGRADEKVDGAIRGDAGNGNHLYRSMDGGKTWVFEDVILGHQMIPAHLMKFDGDTTLMTFGYRFAQKAGVMVCISKNRGRTWNDPNELISYFGPDGGYPSTIRLDDGTFVTAYYTIGNEYHTRYHVGVIRWKLEELIEGTWLNRPALLYYGTDKEYKINVTYGEGELLKLI